MRRWGPQLFVWPLSLLAVSAVLIGAGQALARVDGFHLYGMVQGHGEIVGVIGLVWLVVAAMQRAAKGRWPEGSHPSRSDRP